MINEVAGLDIVVFGIIFIYLILFHVRPQGYGFLECYLPIADNEASILGPWGRVQRDVPHLNSLMRGR